jgi:hypothetical protein
VNRRDVGDVLVLVGALVLAAVPLGWLWALLAPPVPLIAAGRGFALADPEGDQAVAADMFFALVTGVAGAASGVLTHLLHTPRQLARGPALAAGGAVASLATWLVGWSAGPRDLPPDPARLAPGTRLSGPLEIGAHGVLLAWPIAAVGVLLALLVGTVRVSRGERSGP